MKKIPFQYLLNSRMALKTALAVLISGFIVIFALLFYIIQLSQIESIVYSATAALVISFAIHIWSVWQFKNRIYRVRKIAKNIANKRFKDYKNVDPENRDEIDALTQRMIVASTTIEKEILRLNKIENYRKEFIGDISHELKTPIFAIQGFIETLLNGALDDPEVNEMFLQKAMKNVNRLTYLTKDLMEISKLETGELKTSTQDIYLRDLILDVTEHLHYKSQKEQISIRIESFDKNIQVRADRNQIKQVLINLIENAIKYNIQNGFVEIGVKSAKKDTEKILLYVKDSGIGIDSNDIPRVTERFFRVDKSRSREKGGTGLGLSIVKHIIEAHGETLFIESGKDGSTFSFTLTKANHILENRF